MTDKSEVDPEKLDAAQGFMCDIVASGTKHKVPPGVAVTLFGVLSRDIVRLYVEQGKTPEEATEIVATSFMEGLGVYTVFRHVKADKNVH
jgi:hypothetical protein